MVVNEKRKYEPNMIVKKMLISFYHKMNSKVRIHLEIILKHKLAIQNGVKIFFGDFQKCYIYIFFYKQNSQESAKSGELCGAVEVVL